MSQDQDFLVPGLGSPNVPESSSVYVFDTTNAAQPTLIKIVKPGPEVGDVEEGITTYAGSHPNAVVIGSKHVYIANGSDDTISVLAKKSTSELDRISLSIFQGFDH